MFTGSASHGSQPLKVNVQSLVLHCIFEANSSAWGQFLVVYSYQARQAHVIPTPHPLSTCPRGGISTQWIAIQSEWGKGVVHIIPQTLPQSPLQHDQLIEKYSLLLPWSARKSVTRTVALFMPLTPTSQTANCRAAMPNLPHLTLFFFHPLIYAVVPPAAET